MLMEELKTAARDSTKTALRRVEVTITFFLPCLSTITPTTGESSKSASVFAMNTPEVSAVEDWL